MPAFRADSPLWRGIRAFIDLVFLSLLWGVCSLPVFTVGLSTGALLDICHRNVVETDGILFLDWFRSMKRNWRLTLPVGALFAVLLGLQAWDGWLLYGLKEQGHLLGLAWPLFLLTGLMTVGVFLWTMQCCIGFEASRKQTLKNGLFLTLANLPVTLLLLLIVGAAGLLIYLIPAGMFVLPGLGALGCGELMRRTLIKHGYLKDVLKPEETTSKDTDAKGEGNA